MLAGKGPGTARRSGVLNRQGRAGFTAHPLDRSAWSRALGADTGLDGMREFVLPAYCPPDDDEHKEFPYRFLVWLPLKLRDGQVFAGMLLAREVPWNERIWSSPARLVGDLRPCLAGADRQAAAAPTVQARAGWASARSSSVAARVSFPFR